MANRDNTPANGLGGSSYIYQFGTSPNTRTAVSSKSRVLTPHYGNSSAMHQMGVLGTFSTSIIKNVDFVRGIGFGDTIAELVPNYTDPVTLSFERALLYMSTLWQATGYASGIDGPVRSLAHHRWPFDVEHQLVFSSLADMDMGVANTGYSGQSGAFDGGVKAISYPMVTNNGNGHPGNSRGHSALITIYEACWFTSHSTTYSRDQGMIMESGDAQCSAVHDFSSVYGEFLASGNDPTIGQLGSIRFQDAGSLITQAGRGITSGSTLAGPI